MVLLAITGLSIKDLYPFRDNYVVLGSNTKLGIFHILLRYSNLEFIRSSYIDTNTYPQMLLQIAQG